MKIDKREKTFNKYQVSDAFKCFFFLLITMAIVSLGLQVFVSIFANIKGIAYEEALISETVQIVTSISSPIVMIIFFFAYNGIRKIKNKDALNDGQKISLLPISVAIVLSIICVFLFTPFMNLVDYTFVSWGFQMDNSIPLADKMSGSFKYFALGILIFALLPAIGEELIFRGIIHKGLSARYNGFVVIIVTSLLFTLMHGSLQQTVYQVIVGIMLSYLAYVGGSVLYSIILHFLNNTLVLLFSCFNIVPYLSYDEAIYYNIFSKIFPFLIFLLGVVLAGILFWVLKYLRNKNFFRVVKKSKHKKKHKKEEVVVEKLGFRGFVSSMDHTEKVFMLVGFGLVLFIWLINTVSGFMG